MHCVWANGVLEIARLYRRASTPVPGGMQIDVTTCVAQPRATKERTGGDDRYARADALDDDETLSVVPCE
jgi:hypothetical protein